MAIRRGRPKPWSFSGLFLPSMEWEFNVEEIPMRMLEEDPHFGTPMRHLRRKTGKPPESMLLLQMKHAFERIPDSEVKQAFVAAFDGDPDAMATLQHMRPWDLFTAAPGRPNQPHPLEYARIESLCRVADEALQAGNYRRAADAVLSQEELRSFWSDEALEALAASRTLAETVLPRLAAYLELQMSCLARVSVMEHFASPLTWACGEFAPVIQDDGRPGRHFMRYCLGLTRAKTQAAFMEIVADASEADGRLPEIATIKRWFSGCVFPPEASITPVIHALMRWITAQGQHAVAVDAIPERYLMRLFFAARRTKSAQDLAQLLLKVPSGSALLGADAAGPWAVDSYRRWVAHWQAVPASGPTQARQPC